VPPRGKEAGNEVSEWEIRGREEQLARMVFRRSKRWGKLDTSLIVKNV